MSSAFSPVAKLSFAHDSTAPGEASSNLPPRPQHFITRTDGSITPLIAVDELPESMRIVGVPAIISQAATLNMMNLGVQARSQTKYIVEMPEESGSGNTSHLSQRSTTTGGNFQSPGKRVARLKTIKTEERKTAAGVHEVEEWRLGVNSIDEAQVCVATPFHRNTEQFSPPRVCSRIQRLQLMPLSPPTPNQKRSILLALPRHSRRAYLVKRSIVHTGSAGANVIICSKAANTGMRCPTRRLWLPLAFGRYRNGTRTPTRRRVVGWRKLCQATESGENHLPEPSSRFLLIGSHIFLALNSFDHPTSHLMKPSGRLFSHPPNGFITRDGPLDQCLVHAQPFRTVSPRFLDHFLRAPMCQCELSVTSNILLLSLSSSDRRSKVGVPALVFLSQRARPFIVPN